MKNQRSEFLRTVIQPQPGRLSISTIKDGFGPAEVYRVSFDPEEDHPWGRSVVAKFIKPDWPAGYFGPDRELRFYTELLPKLRIPHAELLYAGMDDQTRTRVLILQDLAETYSFPPPQHSWTLEEMRSIAEAYAGLHVAGQESLPAAGEREWMFTYHRLPWTAGDLADMVTSLVDRQIWAPIPGFRSFAERTFDMAVEYLASPPTLLHHEAYPSNIALPRDPGHPAILIDWDLVGWGLAELDLAYIFLLPYRSARLVNRARFLELYWAERARLEGMIPPARDAPRPAAVCRRLAGALGAGCGLSGRLGTLSLQAAPRLIIGGRCTRCCGSGCPNLQTTRGDEVKVAA